MKSLIPDQTDCPTNVGMTQPVNYAVNNPLPN